MINTSDRILDYYTGSTNNTKKRNNWTDKLFVSINLSTQKRISNKIELNKEVYKRWVRLQQICCKFQNDFSNRHILHPVGLCFNQLFQHVCVNLQNGRETAEDDFHLLLIQQSSSKFSAFKNLEKIFASQVNLMSEQHHPSTKSLPKLHRKR